MKSVALAKKFFVESLEQRRLLTAAGWQPIDGFEALEAISDAPASTAIPEQSLAHAHHAAHDRACCCPDCLRFEAAFGSSDNDETAANWDTGNAVDISHVVTIQPIVVSNTNGSQTAGYFGNATQKAIIEDLIDMVWAQAGIDIDWLQPRTWNNSYANFGNGSSTQARPSSDLSWITSQGDTAGVGNSNPLVLDMYFVEIAAGFRQLPNNYANGLAFLGGNGSTLHIGDDLLTFASGREVIARVVAHEIGHNLGLAHVSDPPNLMDDGERLNSSQVATARNSQFAIPLPENSAPVVRSPIDDLSVFAGAANRSFALNDVFSDADGDQLSFSVTSSNTSLVSPNISNGQLNLSFASSATGTASITVTARDPGGKSASDTFRVDVLSSPNGATDWGIVNVRNVNDVSVSGSNWFRLTASQSGLLTVAADFVPTAGDINLEVFDASLNRLAVGNGSPGSRRADISVNSGQVVYVSVSGNNADVDFRLVNAVAPVGNAVRVFGDQGNTQFGFTAGGTHVVAVNGLSYPFESSTFNAFTILARGVGDRIQITGTSTQDVATFRAGSLGMYGAGYGLNAVSNTIEVLGAGGPDIAHIYDSSGIDNFEATQGLAQMTYPSSTAIARNFREVYATSSAGGLDTALLKDSQQKDYFYAQPGYSYMRPQSGNYFLQASGFRRITGQSQLGGGDVATLQDSSLDDDLNAEPGNVRLAARNGFFANTAIGFGTVVANAITGGRDTANFRDGASNDEYVSQPSKAFMRGLGGEYFHLANGFDVHSANATGGGVDSAVFFDGSGNDTFVARPDLAYMTGPGVDSRAAEFESYIGLSQNGGSDTAVLFDTDSDDQLIARPGTVVIRNNASAYAATANGFQSVHGIATSGFDKADLYDGPGNDEFVSRPERSYLLYGDSRFVSYVNNFDSVAAHSNSTGQDLALLFDSSGNDILEARPESVTMRGENGSFSNAAWGFGTVYSYSEFGGTDRAIFYDSQGTDNFIGTPRVSHLRDALGTFSNFATGFASVQAFSNAGGNDTAVLVDSAGNDTLSVGGDSASLLGAGFEYTVSGFSVVTGLSENGGDDELDASAVDYIFNTIGPWR